MINKSMVHIFCYTFHITGTFHMLTDLIFMLIYIYQLKRAMCKKSVLKVVRWCRGSAQVQTLLAACWRFAMVRISDNGPYQK